jgi:hypothetical protein
LRTVADILHVLGYKVSVVPYKEGEQRQEPEIKSHAKQTRSVAC